MRLPVQRYLILLLGLFGFANLAHAHEYFTEQSAAHAACLAGTSGEISSDCQEVKENPGGNYPYYYAAFTCGGGCKVNYFFKNQEPACEAPNYIDVVTGECVQVQEPEECFENGEIYSPDTKTCIPECENGTLLDGYCLLPDDDPDDPDDDCTPDTDGYQGTYGTGNGQVHVCAPAKSECEDQNGTYGIVNGEATCLPEGYGADTVCDSDSLNMIAVNDGYGFTCEKVDGYPGDEEEEEDPEPNTDTDGDGVPDEYDRTNDPDTGNRQRDDILDELGEGNRHLQNIDNRLKGITENGLPGTGGGNGSGDDSGNPAPTQEGQEQTNEELEGIGDTLDEMNEKMDNPDDGYSTDGLGNAATFEQSSNRLYGAISSHPTIAAVSQVPSIASNTSCPTYTFPANDYWGATTMDVHCDILENYRGQLSALFMAVWTIAAVVVFLKA
ncbi:hypothetical protein [Marinobacter zhanjiangensis]|uniref:Thrombospondin type 3 repeat-containing protein n=1 Tax=Marinobacter zhanjiangensis TaxID=578215 RepID=A0ABQ3B856_9GAMM|nr:hypothetical protein [Marinobacter zhanjiangensis]GGY83575.1 hypothetical protein GCM10007071_33600 [Marinobacter zhanjiangensis]